MTKRDSPLFTSDIGGVSTALSFANTAPVNLVKQPTIQPGGIWLWAGDSSKTPKELKLSFFQYLGTSVGSLMSAQRTQEQTNYLPKDIEQDENWSLALIEHMKQLGDDQKRYFLFKHEIGISEAAIARTFSVKRKAVESCIDAAEETLEEQSA